MSKVSQLGAAPAALQTPALCRPHVLTSTTRKPAASTWRRASAKRPSRSLLRLLKLENSQRRKASLGGGGTLSAGPSPSCPVLAGKGNARGAKGRPGSCALPLGPGGQRLALRGRGKVGGHEVPQGQELALGTQQHLSIWGGGADDNVRGLPRVKQPLVSPGGGGGLGGGARAGLSRLGRGGPHPEPSRTAWAP